MIDETKTENKKVYDYSMMDIIKKQNQDLIKPFLEMSR